jgi:hypothetical protein
MPLPERVRHIPAAWKDAVLEILRNGTVLSTLRADSDWLELFAEVENSILARQEAFIAALETPGILGKKIVMPPGETWAFFFVI